MNIRSAIIVGCTLTAVTGLLAMIGLQEEEIKRLKNNLENAKSVNRILKRTIDQNIDLMTDDQVKQVSTIFLMEREFESLTKRNF